MKESREVKTVHGGLDDRSGASAEAPRMTVGGPFFEHELALLDDLAEGAGIEASLVRALLNEQIRSRADGRAGLRSAVDALLESAAVTVAQGRPFHAD